MAYFADKDGNVALIQPDGQIFSVVAGSINTISNAVIPGLSGASFSYDGKKILLKTGSNESPQWSVFDITTKNSQPLTSDMRAVALSPTDHRIAYLSFKSAGVYSLSILDLAAKTPKPQSIVAPAKHVPYKPTPTPTPAPQRFAHGWVQYFDDRGLPYYYNDVLNVSRWELPGNSNLSTNKA